MILLAKITNLCLQFTTLNLWTAFATIGHDILLDDFRNHADLDYAIDAFRNHADLDYAIFVLFQSNLPGGTQCISVHGVECSVFPRFSSGANGVLCLHHSSALCCGTRELNFISMLMTLSFTALLTLFLLMRLFAGFTTAYLIICLAWSATSWTWMMIRQNFCLLHDWKFKASANLQINIHREVLPPVTSCKSLRVMLNIYMHKDAQISHICQKTHFHLRNIGAIHNFLHDSAVEHLIHSLITPRLDWL